MCLLGFLHVWNTFAQNAAFLAKFTLFVGQAWQAQAAQPLKQSELSHKSAYYFLQTILKKLRYNTTYLLFKNNSKYIET